MKKWDVGDWLCYESSKFWVHPFYHDLNNKNNSLYNLT
jgi:hypothetical protein